MHEGFPTTPKQEGPPVPQEADPINEEVSKEEEQYQRFADSQRKFFHENEMDSLKQALHGRESAQASLESSERVISGLQENIDRKRTEIDALKSSIITRVIEFKKIRELQKDIIRKEGAVGDIAEEEIEGKKKLIAFYDRLAREEEEMGKLMEEAYQMNVEFDTQKALEEFEGRDVRQLVEKHGVFFVHDIVDEEWKPSINNHTIDTNQLDWDEQYDLLLGLKPTIAVSTIHPETKQSTFGGGSWGVFLSEGEILGGSRQDAGTVAYSLRDRDLGATDSTIDGISRAISRQTQPYLNGKYEDYKETDTSYNELVMRNPEVAGIYVKWGDEWPTLEEGRDIHLENANGYHYDGWWSKLSKQMERNVPIFVFDKTGDSNSVRMLYDIDIKKRTFKVTPKYDPMKMVDLPGIYKQHLGDVERRKAAMRVFDKTAGALNEQERMEFKPDGSEQGPNTTPYRLY